MPEIRILKGEVTEIATDGIVPHPKNPRKGNMEVLDASIERFGFYGRILVQKSTGYILAGNHRWKSLKAQGLRTVPVEILDVDDETALGILLGDNRTSDLAEYDDEVLAGLMGEMIDEYGEGGLYGTGYTEEDYADLLSSLGGMDSPNDFVEGGEGGEGGEGDEGGEEIEVSRELLEKWGCKYGQLWIVGNHRILCGDAENEEDVKRLLGGERPRLMVTDPPYGVKYRPEWRNEALGEGNRATGEVENDGRADWRVAWLLSPSEVSYVWHAGGKGYIVQESLLHANYEVRSQIIWVKSHFVLSRGHYNQQHEPCFYAVKKGKTAKWIGTHSESSVWNDIKSPRTSGKDENADINAVHGTRKPVECMERPIGNHEGDVYDPFCGSGTTLVACENKGRKGFGMEIKPEYVAVILERLSRLGLGVRLANEG